MSIRVTPEDLRSGKKLIGAWSQLNNSMSAEIMAKVGFDVIVPDMEHAPMTLPDLVEIMQAAELGGAFTMVRAPWNDVVWLKQILDCGAKGIHVPYVSTKEEAEAAVRGCKYPTWGMRGIASATRASDYGLNKPQYWAHANEDVIVMVAIETPAGVANIDEIASVEGVDGIFIGPSDLSGNMGYMGHPEDPAVQEAIRKIEASAKAHGKFLATISGGGEDAKKKYDRGYSLLYLYSDCGAVVSGAKKALAEAKEFIK